MKIKIKGQKKEDIPFFKLLIKAQKLVVNLISYYFLHQASPKSRPHVLNIYKLAIEVLTTKSKIISFFSPLLMIQVLMITYRMCVNSSYQDIIEVKSKPM